MSIEPKDSNRGIQVLSLIADFYKRQPPLEPVQIAVLTYLSLLWFKGPVATVSLSKLSVRINRSRAHLNKALLDLESQNIIMVSQGDNNQNVYSLVNNPIRYGRLSSLLTLTEEDYERIREEFPHAEDRWIATELRAFNAYYLATSTKFRYAKDPLAGFILWLNRSVARIEGNQSQSVSNEDAATRRLRRIQRAAHLRDD